MYDMFKKKTKRKQKPDFKTILMLSSLIVLKKAWLPIMMSQSLYLFTNLD